MIEYLRAEELWGARLLAGSQYHR